MNRLLGFQMLTRRALPSSATAFLALSLAAPAFAQSDKPIPVVAIFSILGDMVKRIGAEHVFVTTLVGPDADAHVYRERLCRSNWPFRLAGSIMSENRGTPFEVLP